MAGRSFERRALVLVLPGEGQISEQKRRDLLRDAKRALGGGVTITLQQRQTKEAASDSMYDNSTYLTHKS